MITVDSTFNNGNGGIILTVKQRSPGPADINYVSEASEFLRPKAAISLALEILHKLIDVPADVDSKIRMIESNTYGAKL